MSGHTWEQLTNDHFDVVSRSGDEFLCRCPWHGDTGRPNLYVNVVKGLFFCQSCGAKGHLKSLGEPSSPAPATLKRRIEMLGQTTPITHYPDSWLAQFDHWTPYWEQERGLDEKTIAKFRLGLDIMTGHQTIPMKNEYGRVLGIIRRTKGKPKYVDPKGVPRGRHLFGAEHLRQSHLGRVAITEGPIDAIACWQVGVPAVALMGSQLTAAQAQLLFRLKVRGIVTMMDNDLPGVKGAEQVYHAAPDSIFVYQGMWRDQWKGKDAGDLLRNGYPDRIRKWFHSAVRWS